MAKLSRAKRKELYEKEIARLQGNPNGLSLDDLCALAEKVGKIRVTIRKGHVDVTGSMDSYLSLMSLMSEQRGKSKNPPRVQIEFVG
jgi:hypothetical protein